MLLVFGLLVSDFFDDIALIDDNELLDSKILFLDLGLVMSSGELVLLTPLSFFLLDNLLILSNF